MNSKYLEYIITIAEEKSFSKAAEKLFLSQPSLSICIRNIEKELGITLFNRTKRTVELTPAGSEYVSWAREMLYSEQRICDKVRRISRGEKKSVSVGCSPFKSFSLMTDAILSFNRLVPDCFVSLHERFSDRLYYLLDTNTADFIIDFTNDHRPQYSYVPLAKESLIIAAHKKFHFHTLRKRPDSEGILPVISIESLYDKPLILLSSQQNLGRRMRELFEGSGSIPNIAVECGSVTSAFIFACEGLGITLLPSEVIQTLSGFRDSSQLNYFCLSTSISERTVSAVFNKGNPLSEEAYLLIESIRETLKKKDANRRELMLSRLQNEP